MPSYLTIAGAGEAAIEVKRSRFIANAQQIKSRNEAEKYLESIQRSHRDARHHVFAYRLREENLLKYSDDGEPSGTAGKPIAEILRRRNLEDVIVVVTRYFGGILLGTGGLAHAYSDAAQRVLADLPVITMYEVARLECCCDYSLYGRIPALLADFDGEIEQTDYSDMVALSFHIPSENVPRFQKALSELSLGKVEAKLVEKVYMRQK